MSVSACSSPIVPMLSEPFTTTESAPWFVTCPSSVASPSTCTEPTPSTIDERSTLRSDVKSLISVVGGDGGGGRGGGGGGGGGGGLQWNFEQRG